MARPTLKINRDIEMKVRLSKEERDLFYAYAESLNMTPSRLMRNIALSQANAKVENVMLLPLVKAYKSYLKITDQKELLKEIEEDE